MRARATITAVLVAAVVPATGGAEPKPTKLDIRPFRDELVVLQDREGGTYVVKPYKLATDKPAIDARIWFGTAGKELYEQANANRSADGASWMQGTWAPRIPNGRVAQLQLRHDGSYSKWCDGKDDVPLTQITGDKAKAILDRSTFMTEFMTRRAHMLSRDDAGVYYYVDKFRDRYGGKGFRVFVGKKGAMKLLALTDVASDSAGEVFSTSTGDLRLTRTLGGESNTAVTWIKGDKRTELIVLDTDINSSVIWSDLGIYKYLGTLCDNI